MRFARRKAIPLRYISQGDLDRLTDPAVRLFRVLIAIAAYQRVSTSRRQLESPNRAVAFAAIPEIIHFFIPFARTYRRLVIFDLSHIITRAGAPRLA